MIRLVPVVLIFIGCLLAYVNAGSWPKDADRTFRRQWAAALDRASLACVVAGGVLLAVGWYWG